MNNEDATLLAKRANRFSGKGGLWNASMDHHSAYRTQLHDRYMGKGTIGGNTSSLTGELDFEQMTVQGTCQVLEKDYLRLTAPPQAALVRPQPILERHLEQLQQAYYDTNNTNKTKKKRDYLWLCSQLKAVRQDCTVQRITNAFAIRVYETHARIALQECDLNEFNQCQTQLKELYVTNEENENALQHQSEFLAYRLLYYVFLSMTEQRGSSSTCADMLALLRSLRMMVQTNQDKEQAYSPAIQHALQVRHAQAMGDYHSFFQLHASAPNLGRCLTQRMVATMQWRALVRIAKAYRPTVAIDFVLQQLGFFSCSKDEEDEENRQTGRQWLLSCGCILTETEFITKDSIIHEPQEQIKNSLI